MSLICLKLAKSEILRQNRFTANLIRIDFYFFKLSLSRKCKFSRNVWGKIHLLFGLLGKLSDRSAVISVPGSSCEFRESESGLNPS